MEPETLSESFGRRAVVGIIDRSFGERRLVHWRRHRRAGEDGEGWANLAGALVKI
jgi:hypothetical protein